MKRDKDIIQDCLLNIVGKIFVPDTQTFQNLDQKVNNDEIAGHALV